MGSGRTCRIATSARRRSEKLDHDRVRYFGGDGIGDQIIFYREGLKGIRRNGTGTAGKHLFGLVKRINVYADITVSISATLCTAIGEVYDGIADVQVGG